MADTESTEKDFAACLEANLARLQTEFEVGDRVAGVVTAIDRITVFVDVNARSDGIIDRSEFLDDEGQLSVEVGDQVEAYFVGTEDDDIRLSTKMTGQVAEASLQDAFESGIPIEGRVASERKGGFEIEIGHRTAFCPYSQIDLYKQDSESYIGERFTFVITESSEGGRNLVVSRRSLLEKERAEKRETLQGELTTGSLVKGKVTRIAAFGVFVDLGGVEGLVHVSELGWGHSLKPEDILSEGEDVEVLILELDWDNDRIALSLKHAAGDPWETFGEKFTVGKRYEGQVTQLAPFGAFVELEPGIEGLVHVSQLGAGRRVNHPDEVVSVGDHVEVSILNVDPERRRISLSMADTIGLDIERDGPSDEFALAEGRTLPGTVDGVRDFGVFVRLPNGQSGLLHVSQVELRGSSNSRRALFDMFPPGSNVEVVVKEVKGDRISLTLPGTLAKEAESLDLKDLRDSGSDGLGSLGDLLDGLKL